MKATIFAISFVIFASGIFADEFENRQWNGGSAGGSSSAFKRQIRKLEYQLEEEQKKNQELTETNEILKENNEKCQGSKMESPVAFTTKGTMRPLTFPTTQMPNYFRPSGPSRPSYEVVKLRNELRKERKTNGKIRMQLQKYKKLNAECQTNSSAKRPMVATERPAMDANECKDDLKMADARIHEIREELEAEERKNQKLIQELEMAKNKSSTIQGELEQCMDNDQNGKNDSQLHRCQQDLEMKKDVTNQLNQLENYLKKAKKEIEKLKSQSSGLAGQLKPLDSFKKDVAALVESLYERCKETYGNNPQCMLRNYRGRLVKSRCETVRRFRLNGLNWINKIAKRYRILEEPFCIERKPYNRP